MIRALSVVAVVVAPVAAYAQAQAPITATPLLPPSTQYPQIQQQPLPPPQQQQQQPQAQQQPAPQAAPQPVRGTWLPEGNAVLQVLDKVNAQNAVLTVKVGDTTQYGALSIA